MMRTVTSTLPPTGRAAWNDDSERAARYRELIQAAVDRCDFIEMGRLIAEAEQEAAS
ncbi:MAG: hypothetical protein AAF715_19515 [Myxococcota bacterium]